MDKYISMVHGSGGKATGDLISELFAKEFSNPVLDAMEDAAVVSGAGRIAVTTDSFVVTPVEFRGGDIGRLSVCGTVNDMLMRGADPFYMTCGFILEEGTDTEVLRRCVHSMAVTATEAGTKLIAGDTKVVEGHGGFFINTTGVGRVPEGVDISAAGAREGDVIIVSGTMGDHHAAILSERMSIETDIRSDAAPLVEMVKKLRSLRVHTLRDITRGGLGTVLKELACASEKTFVIDEESIPVSDKVRDFCGLLGLDPIYMGNEGKLIAIVDKDDADSALSAIRSSRYGEKACVIGRVEGGESGRVYIKTGIGGLRELDVLTGEGLPRIC